MASPSLWLPAPTRTPSVTQSGGGGGGVRGTSGRTTTTMTRPNDNSSWTGALTVPTPTGTSSVMSVSSDDKKGATSVVPSYEERCRCASEWSRLTPAQRKNRKPLFVPRSLKDFDDGGAFPEIHVAQYPRHLGNPHLDRKSNKGKAGGGSGGEAAPVAGNLSSSNSRSIVNVEIDATGEVSYDAVVKGGTNADKIVYTRHSDLRGSQPTKDDLALPTPDEESQTAARTAAALNALVSAKTAWDKPTGSAMIQAATASNREENTEFVRYTPRPDAPGYNPAAKQRIVQVVPAQVDPMMPPRHKHKKAPRGPAEDPVPILHAPPEKLTKEEREKWNIPACISNWKNTRGYTIPLDKRLAADGRGLREHVINNNFATLSESLYVAERQAREEVRMRAQVQKKLILNERERREEELRQLANKARMERANAVAAAQQQQEVRPAAAVAVAVAAGAGGGETVRIEDSDKNGHGSSSDDDDDQDENHHETRETHNRRNNNDNNRNEPTEEEVAARQREQLRIMRKKERERELRLERSSHYRHHPNENKDDNDDNDEETANKRRKLEEERDVSEKIALGVHKGTGTLGGQVDSRLYNQEGGLSSGFGPDDEYNTYTKPMFDRESVTSSSIYRPSTKGMEEYNADEQYDKLLKTGTSKFQPDKGFDGADGSAGARAGPRSGPVQFEKGGQKD